MEGAPQYSGTFDGAKDARLAARLVSDGWHEGRRALLAAEATAEKMR